MVCACVHMCVHSGACMCVYTGVCICVCMCVNNGVCMCVCAKTASKHRLSVPAWVVHNQALSPCCVSAGGGCVNARERTQSACPLRLHTGRKLPSGGASASLMLQSTPPIASSSLQAQQEESESTMTGGRGLWSQEKPCMKTRWAPCIGFSLLGAWWF